VSLPTPAQLDQHPEAGVLALLHGALLLAVRSLVAVHPDIDDPERPCWAPAPSPASRPARRVIHRAHALLGALADYRTTRDGDADADIPF
jgi:hypothetical protein